MDKIRGGTTTCEREEEGLKDEWFSQGSGRK